MVIVIFVVLAVGILLLGGEEFLACFEGSLDL